MQKGVQAEPKKTIKTEDATLHNVGVAGGLTMWQTIAFSKRERAQIVEKLATVKLSARRQSLQKRDPTLPMEVCSHTMAPRPRPEERYIHLGGPKSPLRGVLGIRLTHPMEVIIRREDRHTLMMVPRHIV